MKQLKLLLFTLGIMAPIAWTQAKPNIALADSIGLERKNDQTYILHQVDPSETLYSIARRYGVDMKQITASNPAVDFTQLRIKQIIRVPFTPRNLNNTTATASNTNSYSNYTPQSTYNSSSTNYSTQTQASSVAVSTSKTQQIGYMVKSGDSLYRIAQRFGMTLERLKIINELQSNALQPGQLLLVEVSKAVLSNGNPYAGQGDAVASAKPDEKLPSWIYEPAVSKDAEMLKLAHTVRTDDTLDGIATQYNVSRNRIIELNPNFDFNRGLPVGQNIFVDVRYMPKNGNTTLSTASNTNTAGTAAATTPTQTINDIGSSGLPSNRRVTGMGAKITGNTAINSQKHLALHSTADEGTYIKVTNPNNGQYTLVKVIGRLDAADVNAGIAIKISNSAATALGVIDSRFQVFMEYND